MTFLSMHVRREAIMHFSRRSCASNETDMCSVFSERCLHMHAGRTNEGKTRTAEWFYRDGDISLSNCFDLREIEGKDKYPDSRAPNDNIQFVRFTVETLQIIYAHDYYT